MGIAVHELDNAEAYAELAWYELVEEATKSLPILSIEHGRFVSGDRVKEYLYHAEKKL